MSPLSAGALLWPGQPLPAPGALTRDAIQTAFHKHILADHPDQGGNGATVTAYKQARDVLLAYASGDSPKCSVCGGKGTVKGNKFRPIPCPKGCLNGSVKAQLRTRRT